MLHVSNYFEEVSQIAASIDKQTIESAVQLLRSIRDVKRGRVFVLGVGGSAANASHMVNDLRKLCNIETYAPTDNVSELTARTNDDGFDTVFEEYLKTSKLNDYDALVILSVGGGNAELNVSVGLIRAIDYAKKSKASVISIVGKPNGYAAQQSNVAVIVPEVNSKLVTPYSEAFQAVVWHCIVSHPDLQVIKTKW